MVGEFIDTKKRYLEYLKEGKEKGVISEDEYNQMVENCDKNLKQMNISDIDIKKQIIKLKKY